MTMIGVANGVVVGGLALILTLDASVQEFTELVSLSDDARLTVFVNCSAPLTVPSSPIKPASWRTE